MSGNTLHCCARRFCEERNEQEIDEVDKGQAVVPEEASCKHNKTWVNKQVKSLELLSNIVQKSTQLQFINPAYNYTYLTSIGITINMDFSFFKHNNY